MASVPDYRTGSPVPSSGRASPVNPRLRQKDDEGVNKKDKVVKRWAATVERVLATFEQSVDEWADYISFLGRLLKAIQTRPPNADDVPSKLLVAKRLAQCLNPALPPGVHQKALEVYAYIFSFLGEEGLSRNLSLYLPGLAPLVSFASLSVKPLVLGVYEEYLTKLDPAAIRPALKALILSLLPGLEEENSDEFEKTLHILDSFKTLSGSSERRPSVQAGSARDQYFWQCVFLATITSSSRRSGALAYLVRNLPTLGGAQAKKATSGEKAVWNGDSLDEAILAVAQPDPGLLLRCFCAGLTDENVLVQRGFLDLLVERLPLSSSVLQEKADAGDFKRLVTAATCVVLRRDMSLNRRLWAWFLGPSAVVEAEADPRSPLSPNPAALKTPTTAQDQFSQLAYFKKNGQFILVQALQEQLKAPTINPTDKTRTLRLCLALMDRVEIGASVVSEVFVPALSSVQDFQFSKAPKTAKTEVLRSGSAFFDSVESHVIWREINQLIATAFETSDAASALAKMTFVVFIITKFNIREEDMQAMHLPLAALFVLEKLNRLLEQGAETLSERLDLVIISFRVAQTLLHHIPPRVLASQEPSSNKAKISSQLQGSRFAERIEQFYSRENPSTKRLFSEAVMGAGLSDLSCEAVSRAIAQYGVLSRPAIEGAVSVLDATFRKVPWYSASDNVKALMDRILLQSTELEPNEAKPVDMAFTLTITSVLEVLNANEGAQLSITPIIQSSVIPQLVKNAWSALSPGRPQHHVEASRCLWRLHAVTSGDDLVESTIVSFGALDDEALADSVRLEHAYRFTVFWQQSHGQSEMARNRRAQVIRVQNTLTAGKLQLLGRPLFQMLDCLLELKDDVGSFIGHWLETLPDLAVVVNVVLAHMDKTTRPLTVSEVSSSELTDIDSNTVDLETCVYFVRLLEKVVYYARPSLEKTLQQSASEESREQLLMRFQFIVDSCVKIQTTRHTVFNEEPHIALRLRQASLALLEQASQFLSAESLTRLRLDLVLLDELQKAIEFDSPMLQIALTKASSTALTRRSDAHKLLHELAIQSEEADAAKGIRRSSITQDASHTANAVQPFAVPSKVLSCILNAFSDRGGRPVLDCWFEFLKDALQLYGPNIFQIILPLNECFCRVLRSMAEDLKQTFAPDPQADLHVDETAMVQVLNALERPLEIAHGTLETLLEHENAPKNEQQAASFFSMVSVLTPDGGKVKSSADNNRLTVLLCFKDALRVCFEIWSIDESSAPGILDDSTRLASFKHTTLRLRNRTRRIVEHLFQARELECVETLVALWHDCMMEGDTAGCNKVLSLLATVETARPKVTVPALFNAIYSRTHPAALDPEKRSSLTSDVSEVTLAAFSISYLRSLEDDATDEIWQSCLTFLKDVLTSPLNHRQILVQLLEFAVDLGAKINNTNFGEQRKMRRELGDLFIRLLSAITTIRPPGTNTEQTKEAMPDTTVDGNQWYKDLMTAGSADLVSVLANIFPRLTDTLLERDRVPSVAASVSAQILGPTLKSKTFPQNVDRDTLELLKVVGQITEASKTYKRDVSDAFNDARFFSSNLALVQDGWMPVLRQWAIGDNERLPELFGRLTAPAAAGLMFGVGASSARLEADRRTQLTLRRIATLLLAGPQDAFVVNLSELTSKVIELLNASASSSPSSLTRAELYMVFRTLLLRVSPNHLNPLWPIINSEITDTLSSAMPNSSQEAVNPESLLQLCKLIDTLLLLNLDEFQLQEWLFITDTTDAVYRPSHIEPAGLTDILAEGLDAEPNGLTAAHLTTGTSDQGLRKPLLSNAYIKKVRKDQYRDKIFRPFFRQLSIASFEGSYSMDPPDIKACIDDLVADIFDDSTLV